MISILFFYNFRNSLDSFIFLEKLQLQKLS